MIQLPCYSVMRYSRTGNEIVHTVMRFGIWGTPFFTGSSHPAWSKHGLPDDPALHHG